MTTLCAPSASSPQDLGIDRRGRERDEPTRASKSRLPLSRAAEAAAEPIADAGCRRAESSEDISMEDVLGSKGRKAPASADDEATVESQNRLAESNR